MISAKHISFVQHSNRDSTKKQGSRSYELQSSLDDDDDQGPAAP